jgi:hypothetical protein
MVRIIVGIHVKWLKLTDLIVVDVWVLLLDVAMHVFAVQNEGIRRTRSLLRSGGFSTLHRGSLVDVLGIPNEASSFVLDQIRREKLHWAEKMDSGIASINGPETVGTNRLPVGAISQDADEKKRPGNLHCLDSQTLENRGSKSLVHAVVYGDDLELVPMAELRNEEVPAVRDGGLDPVGIILESGHPVVE